MSQFAGYSRDEVEQVAEDILLAYEDAAQNHTLTILGLCAAIVKLGDSDTLDMACMWIDQLADPPAVPLELDDLDEDDNPDPTEYFMDADTEDLI